MSGEWVIRHTLTQIRLDIVASMWYKQGRIVTTKGESVMNTTSNDTYTSCAARAVKLSADITDAYADRVMLKILLGHIATYYVGDELYPDDFINLTCMAVKYYKAS